MLWFPAVNSEPCVSSLTKVGRSRCHFGRLDRSIITTGPLLTFSTEHMLMSIKKRSAWQDVTAVLTTNVTIWEFNGNGSTMPLELCTAAADAVVERRSRLYVYEIRLRRLEVSMTVYQAGMTGVIKRTNTLSKSPNLRFLQRNAFENHHRCAW